VNFYAIICLLGLLLCFDARAARPFVTDDARLTTAGSCQLESWVRAYPDSQELWALPACNPTGNFEITLGSMMAKVNDESPTRDYVLQFKTLFKTLETNGWGVGLAVGTLHHPETRPGPNQLGNTYAYLPLSISFQNDKIIMHSNLGWLRDSASSQDNMTWGLGGEFQTGTRLLLIAESYGDDKTRPYLQTGVRFSVLPNLFQIDATTGQQLGSSSSTRWISFGLRWTPERMF
jgi:hypothetical protein